MATPVTAIFDIGKTNKKFYLFDETYQVVYHLQQHWPETTDDDGFASDDLSSVVHWMKGILNEYLEDSRFKIKAINFSGYGASLVHLNQDGHLAAPFYNYLKPLPEDIETMFYQSHGPQKKIGRETASPALGLLNSGLQLYFLKYAKPHFFKNTHFSLHLPQFLSYLFTGKYFSDYTSLGCHTGLWHFKKQDYHPWVADERLLPLLAPLAPHPWVMTTLEYTNKSRSAIRIGIGIHDSSAALQPYLLSTTQHFILLSTGTWSIALNPFSQDELTDEDLANDVLFYMRPDGHPVRAARLFLGHIHETISRQIADHFHVDPQTLKKYKLDSHLFSLVSSSKPAFHLNPLPYHRLQPSETLWSILPTPAYAYHQLIWELVQEQMQAIKRCAGSTEYHGVFLDGGFAENDLFKRMLAWSLRDTPLWCTQLPAGSALGAALMVGEPLPVDYLSLHGGLEPVELPDI